MRELRNVVQRVLLLSEGPVLDADVLTFELPPKQGLGAPGRAPHKVPEGMTLQQWLEQVERECVEDALRTCDNQRGKAAKRLGLSRTSLFERMKAWGYGHEKREAQQEDLHPQRHQRTYTDFSASASITKALALPQGAWCATD